jgi:hypothetical protein
MTSRIKLVYREPGSLNSDWMQPLVKELFDLELWNPDQVYDYRTTLALRHEHSEPYAPELRTVIDNLWEVKISSTHYVMQNPAWFWYNESLWYTHWGYDQYQPCKTYSKLALMPMRKSKPNRDRILELLGSRLTDLIWSYVEKGRQLPDDIDPNNALAQRYFNPAWYNQTYFSIVVETVINAQATTPVFISEKTYKPLAFRHPFVVYGGVGTLAQLKSQGFETFDNLFDQSYDTIKDPQARASAIIQCVDQFKTEPYSKETVAKLEHNHSHFFNASLVKQYIRTEILEPLLHYAET